MKWAQWDKTQSRELLVCSYVCASHCAQLLHTILHRTDLIVFPLTLQTITTARMMSIWGKGGAISSYLSNYLLLLLVQYVTGKLSAVKLYWCSSLQDQCLYFQEITQNKQWRGLYQQKSCCINRYALQSQPAAGWLRLLRRCRGSVASRPLIQSSMQYSLPACRLSNNTVDHLCMLVDSVRR